MRSVTGTGLVVAALAATLAALLLPIWSFAKAPGGGGGGTLAGRSASAGITATRFGPLSPADRDFIERVRLAGLWELPAGQQAEERGTTSAVRTAGDHLVEGHTELDRQVRQVAAQLAVDLPSQPNEQQRRWLDELSAARGSAYDEKFANILRAAHGKVFALVAQIRATTRNALVRGLADEANSTVLDHMTVLEATGLVDFDALATGTGAGPGSGPSAPAGSPSPAGPPAPAGTSTPTGPPAHADSASPRPAAPPRPATTQPPTPPPRRPVTPSSTYSLPPAAHRPTGRTDSGAPQNPERSDPPCPDLPSPPTGNPLVRDLTPDTAAASAPSTSRSPRCSR